MFNEFGFLACKIAATGGQKNEQRASRDGDFLRQSAEANADQARARYKLKFYLRNVRETEKFLSLAAFHAEDLHLIENEF